MNHDNTTPLGLGEILFDSFKLFKAGFFNVLPFAIIAVIAAAELTTTIINDHNFFFNTMSLYQINWQSFATNFIIALIVSWCYTGIYFQCSKILNRQKTTFKKASIHASKYFISLFLTMFVYFITVFIGLGLFIIPGIFLAVSCVLAATLAATETLNPFKAMFQSYRIITPSWWRALILLVLPMVIIFLLGYVVNRLSVQLFINATINFKMILLIRTILSAILGIFFMVWYFCLNLLVLQDLRLRKSLTPVSVEEDKIIDDSLEDFLDQNS